MPYALHPHVPLFTLATAASPQSTPDFANLMRTILELPAAPPAAPPPVQPPPPANLQELLNNPFAAINAFLWGAGAPQAGGAREPGGAAQVPGGEDEFGENLAQQQQQQPIWLFLKLAFMSYMFSQGSDRYRFFTINAVAVLIFVVQTGIAGWLYRLVRGAPPALVANNNNGNVNVNANGNNDAQEGPQDRPAAQEGENPPNEGAAQEPTEEVPPPPPQPWYLELKDIAVSFITSLVPEQPNVI
ncbi:hypothetical protein BJ742DRAFT_110216 [Cladochytrium replicatum]|nr:hypothetical protein BJ742DRAFT_110216 [Cladochytrium replicatum]